MQRRVGGTNGKQRRCAGTRAAGPGRGGRLARGQAREVRVDGPRRGPSIRRPKLPQRMGQVRCTSSHVGGVGSSPPHRADREKCLRARTWHQHLAVSGSELGPDRTKGFQGRTTRLRLHGCLRPWLIRQGRELQAASPSPFAANSRQQVELFEVDRFTLNLEHLGAAAQLRPRTVALPTPSVMLEMTECPRLKG